MKLYRIVILTLMIALVAPLQATELTVADGTSQDWYIPLAGLNNGYTYPQHTQCIYPASMLTAMTGQYISELRFYCSQPTPQWTTPITVKLGPAPSATFSSNTFFDTAGFAVVFVGVFEPTSGGYIFHLSEPWLYTGGDLLVDITDEGGGTELIGYNYGVVQNCSSCYQFSYDETSTSRYKKYFLPKVTFTYDSYACGRPTNIVADTVGATDVLLHWNSATNSTAYYVSINGTDYPVQADTMGFFSGLTPNSLNMVIVNSICNSGDTLASQPYVFHTIDTSTALWLPYFCDFEEQETNGLPRYWYRSDSCTVSAELRPSVTAGIAHSGNYKLEMGGYYCGPNVVFTDILPVPARELHVTFWYKLMPYMQVPLEVGVIDSNGVFHTIAEYTTDDDDYDWHYADLYTDTISVDGNVRLALRWFSDYNCMIDELSIEHISYCPRPTAVAVDNIGPTSVTAHLTPSDSGASMLVSIDSIPYLTTSDTVVSITGLVPARHYILSVRTLCPTGDTSQATTVDFRTECESLLTLPWYENFDSIAIGDAHPCLVVTERHPLSQWDQASPVVSGPGGYNIAPHSGPAMLEIKWTDQELLYIATPIIDADPTSLHISFWYKPNGYFDAGHVQAGFMDAPTDTASFIPFHSSVYIHTSGEFGWRQVEIYTDTFSIQLPDSVCLAFRVPASGYVYFDDIEITSTYNCPQPLDQKVVNLNAVEATLTWTASAAGGEYEVLLDGNVFASAVFNTHYVLWGLEPQHTYTAGVRAVCSGVPGEVQEVTFSTPCSATTLPFNEDFEVADDDTKLPPCWMAPIRSGGYGVGYPQVRQNASAHQGLGWFDFWGFDDEVSLALSPRFQFPAGGLYIRFWEKHSSYDSTLTIGLMTDMADLSTLVPLLVLNGTNGSYSWQEHEIYVDSLPGADTVCLAFYSTGGPSVAIDDLSIVAIHICYRPSQPTVVDVWYDSAILAWSGAAPAYELRYGTTSDSMNASSMIVYDTAATLHNLASSTEYHAWVRAICGVGDTSEWLPLGTFITDTASHHNDTTGIEGPMRGKEWNMWPNPSHGDVTVSVAHPSTITVVDMTGRVVITSKPISSSFTIQRSSLPAGTYFVQIASGDGVTTSKLVIL